MRAQRKLTFYISGYIGEFTGFEASIARIATTVCGGCTIHHAEGWWTAEAGEKSRPLYLGDADFEDVMVLTVTCEVEKVDIAYQRIAKGIVAACGVFNVNADWVHVLDEEVSGRHFSVKQEQEAFAEDTL